MSGDIDPRTRHLLLVMGMCSAVAKAFRVAVQKNGWSEPDPERTEQAFAVIGPMMLSGLPEQEVVEQLEEPYPNLYLEALAFCKNPELDGKTYPRGAARLPAWAFRHIHGALPTLLGDRDFLELVERYFASDQLKQVVAEMASRVRTD
jgi:hypothetical protein